MDEYEADRDDDEEHESSLITKDLIIASDVDENGDLLDVDDDSSEYKEFLDDEEHEEAAEMQDEIDKRGVVFITSESTTTFGKPKLSSFLPASRYVPQIPVSLQALSRVEIAGALKPLPALCNEGRRCVAATSIGVWAAVVVVDEKYGQVFDSRGEVKELPSIQNVSEGQLHLCHALVHTIVNGVWLGVDEDLSKKEEEPGYVVEFPRDFTDKDWTAYLKKAANALQFPSAQCKEAWKECTSI